MKNNSYLYRHEHKFLVNQAQALLVQKRIQNFMPLDQNVGEDSYRVTSLYFDDYRLSSYFDKLNGVPYRTKFRVRTYDLNKNTINLEAKIKKDQVIRKDSFSLDYQQFSALIAGEEVDFTSTNPLATYFPLVAQVKHLLPKIIVDYQRRPYVWQAKNIRITLDEELKYSTTHANIFNDHQQIYQSVLKSDEVLLEIKYNDFLPYFIKQLISEFALYRIAFSKYTICLGQARNRWQMIHT